jgi:hypothetical protein
MMKFLSQLSTPAALLCILLVISQIVTALYVSRDLELPPEFILLVRLGLVWGIGWWLQKDNHRHQIKWVYDMGLFLYIAWPFIMPYYLFKTRGIKALLTILAFAGIYLGAYLIGIAVHALLAQSA